MIIFITIIVALWIWLIYEFKKAPLIKKDKNERIDYDNDRIF